MGITTSTIHDAPLAPDHIDNGTNGRGDNPYVGPRTFQEADSVYFFGRDREAKSLLMLVTSKPITLFYSASGAGKSSLLNTRIVPKLRERHCDILPIGRVSGEIPRDCAYVDNIFVFNLLSRLDQTDTPPQHLARVTLADFLQSRLSEEADVPPLDTSKSLDASTDADRQLGNGGSAEDNHDQPMRVLIIDQFEEIFTTNLSHWEKREIFLSSCAT